MLLVEDESVVREVTVAVLERAGYEVLACSGPEEALRLGQERRQDIGLLLTDVVMPGMNGVELAQQLTRANPGLITVFMSGYANSGVLKNTLLKNVTYLQKPFTIETLLSAVGGALRNKPGEAERALADVAV